MILSGKIKRENTLFLEKYYSVNARYTATSMVRGQLGACGKYPFVFFLFFHIINRPICDNCMIIDHNLDHNCMIVAFCRQTFPQNWYICISALT